MKILKRIGSILLDVLIVIVFIVSTLVVIATITAKRENGQANVLGYTINSVQTESMKGAINAGDLVISKVVTDANKGEFQLKKGDVVSFYQELDTCIIDTAENTNTLDEFEEKVNRFVYFASNGCGDYYCYRVLPNGETDASAIYIWEHELFEVREVAKDIPDLIIKYYNNEV